MSERKPCRCLLKDSLPQMQQRIEEYIALIPDGERVPEVVRQARLRCCLACNALRDGTCGLCGCYVEARTARARIACPDVPPRWQAYPDGERKKDGGENHETDTQ